MNLRHYSDQKFEKNLLLAANINNEITHNQLLTYIKPHFYDTHPINNSSLVYHESFIEELFSKFEDGETINIYYVLFSVFFFAK